MTTIQKLQYAQSRLALAKMMSDTSEEIAKWQEHADYWKNELRAEDEKMLADSAKAYGSGWRRAWGWE